MGIEVVTEGRAGGSTPALRIEGLRKSFGDVDAVAGVDLVLAPGEFMTLLGPSGCGKTTTLRVVAGLEQATEGRVEIFGEECVNATSGLSIPPNKRPIGMVFQSYALWPHMTALQNVAFPLQNKDREAAEGGGTSRRKRPASEIRQRSMETLDLVQCGHLSDRYPGEMSGGQQQRIALARAIVHSPPLVLLDEPLSNLDASLRRDLRLELRRLQEDIGFAALYVTHDQTEALAMSDQVVLMREGRIEQIDTPRKMFEVPRSPYAAGFIGDHNVLRGVISECNDDGTATVKTAVGVVRARPSRAGVVPLVGATGMVAVRADRIRLDRLPSDSQESNGSAATATVLGSSYNGAHVDFFLESGESDRFTVRSYSGDLEFDRGERVSVQVPTEVILTEVLAQEGPPS